MIRMRRNAPDEDGLLRKRTQGAIEILERWIASLRQELAALAGRLYHQGPCAILIRGTAHPGTVLKYQDDVVVVSKPVVGRRWVFREKGPLPKPDGQAI
jgi:hypothetical protein